MVEDNSRGMYLRTYDNGKISSEVYISPERMTREREIIREEVQRMINAENDWWGAIVRSVGPPR